MYNGAKHRAVTTLSLLVFSILRSAKSIPVSPRVAGFHQPGRPQSLRCRGRDGASRADGRALSQRSPSRQDDGVWRDEGRVSEEARPEWLQDAVSGGVPFHVSCSV